MGSGAAISPDDRIDVAQAQAEIADELLRVHHESYGTGAERVDVNILGELVIVVLDIELTPAERTLISAGRSDAVKRTREDFQLAIAPTFSAIVERSTGRKVSSFLSAMSVEPPYAVEFFRLAPPR